MRREFVPVRALGQAVVDSWNAKFPIGTPVQVLLDNGLIKETKTCAPAQMLGGHTAVIWLEAA